MALVTGLMAAGCRVHDIGLAVTPMAYFAQFALDVPAVAMVTASHNENGWTGVKMGARAAAHLRPGRDGPPEGDRPLRRLQSEGRRRLRLRRRISPSATSPTSPTGRSSTRRMKVVAACGNGTAGAFAPRVLAALGAEVVPLDTELDYTFPRYNPNPEDLEMLHAISAGGEGRQAPTSASASTATATAAASSTTTARRSSPTRSASCSPATSRRSTRARPSSST